MTATGDAVIAAALEWDATGCGFLEGRDLRDAVAAHRASTATAGCERCGGVPAAIVDGHIVCAVHSTPAEIHPALVRRKPVDLLAGLEQSFAAVRDRRMAHHGRTLDACPVCSRTEDPDVHSEHFGAS